MCYKMPDCFLNTFNVLKYTLNDINDWSMKVNKIIQNFSNHNTHTFMLIYENMKYCAHILRQSHIDRKHAVKIPFEHFNTCGSVRRRM